MRAFAVLVALGIVASSGVAHGDAKSEAAALFTEGRALYDAGQFDKAAVKFKAAHALDRDPVYLFNTGQALRFAKKCDEAVGFYERFLKDLPDAPNRDAVAVYLGEARACAKERKLHDPPPPPPPPPPKPAKPPVATGSTTGARVLGAVVAGIGLAGVGAGVYFTRDVGEQEAAANAIIDRCNAEGCAWVGGGDRVEKHDANARTSQLLAVASYSVGAIALAVGTYLILRKPARRREAAVGLAPTADGVFATTAWAF